MVALSRVLSQPQAREQTAHCQWSGSRGHSYKTTPFSYSVTGGHRLSISAPLRAEYGLRIGQSTRFSTTAYFKVEASDHKPLPKAKDRGPSPRLLGVCSLRLPAGLLGALSGDDLNPRLGLGSSVCVHGRESFTRYPCWRLREASE